MKFKVGDKVKFIENDKEIPKYYYGIYEINPRLILHGNKCLGNTYYEELAEIVSEKNGYYAVKWKNVDDKEMCLAFEPKSLELIKTNKNTMKKLNNLFKKLTDPSVQSLSEAGILNGDLELTEEGRKELMTILFLANKDALVARAEEIIKEAKEDK